ncbi:MAG: sigma-70 family RNA polymerase sigma factor [Anaerolineales bacterium]|jgi:RNA polymerase sigma-70 factor (ECF subfamily)
MPSQEHVWLEAAKRLEKEALAAIYDAYSEELYRYALRLIGDATRAEDLMSETFSRFLSALERGGGPTKHLRAYLYRTTHNLAMDLYRRGQNEAVEDPGEHPPTRPERDLERSVEWKAEQEQAASMLRLLTDEQRQVIVLKFFQGMENEEIAETMQKTVGAVKALQHRGLNSLRRAFETLQAETERAT